MGRRNKGRGCSKKKRGGKSKSKQSTPKNNNDGASDSSSVIVRGEKRPDEWRFNVGDRVDCRLNSEFEEDWGSGTIIMRNWEIELEEELTIVPYRIRLDNGTTIYAPVDVDGCIKRSSTPAVNVKSYKLGSRVECLRDGEWTLGTVTQSNPYWLDDDPVESGPYHIQYDCEPIGIPELFWGPADGIKSSKVEQIMVNEELRFSIGDRVECLVGRNPDLWLPGTVTKTNYADRSQFGDDFVAPYQIRLDKGGLIYAPVDDDITIKEYNKPAPSCWICYDDQQFEDNEIVRECACRGEANGYVHTHCLAQLAITKAGNKHLDIDDENPLIRCITCKQEFKTNSASFSALARRCMSEFGDNKNVGKPWYGVATCMFFQSMIGESGSYEEDGKRYDMAEKTLLNRSHLITQAINLGSPNTPHLMLDLSRLYDVLAFIHEEKGELENMKGALDGSLHLIKALEDGFHSRRKINILSSLAKHACLVGNTSAAVERYEECISLTRSHAKKNDVLLATLLLKSGNLDLELGNTERGIEQITESVDIMTTIYGSDHDVVSKLGGSLDMIREGKLETIPKALLVWIAFPRVLRATTSNHIDDES